METMSTRSPVYKLINAPGVSLMERKTSNPSLLARNILLLILVGALMFFFYVMGQVSVAKGPEGMLNYVLGTGDSKVYLVGQALTLIKARYVAPIEEDEGLVYGAIEGMANSLHKAPYNDPYSGFLDPSGWDMLQATTTGGYAGIGILIGPDWTRPFPIIMSVFPNSPSAEKGLMENDLIIEVAGQSTENMLLDEAAALIKGEAGTEVTLKVIRGDSYEPLEFAVSREHIEVPTVTEVKKLSDDIGYFRILMFSTTTAQEAEEALKGFEADGVKSVVIDLRNNSGGLLQGSVDLSDLFVKDGLICSVKYRAFADDAFYADKSRHKFEFPVVILTNGYTASASEVFAGAMRDHGLALLVGDKTFGKGVVQEISELESGKVAMALTVGSYYTPSGHNLNGNGLEPDFKVTFDDYKVKYNDLAQLEDQIKRKNEEMRALTGQFVESLRAHDYQLDTGKDVLNEWLAGKKPEGRKAEDESKLPDAA